MGRHVVRDAIEHRIEERARATLLAAQLGFYGLAIAGLFDKAVMHTPIAAVEAAACGTPILSDWWVGLDSFFNPGSEILVARTTDEAVRALHTSPDELEKIAHAARERTMDEHTAERRVIELEKLFERAAGCSDRSVDSKGNQTGASPVHFGPSLYSA